MNRKLIFRFLGAILSIEAFAMIPSCLLALHFQDGDAPLLGLCMLALLIPGLLLWFLIHPDQNAHLRLREGYLIVALGWLMLSIGGALPFFFSDRYHSFTDALFEAVSGFTTTGATVTVYFDGFPRGLMFWRASTHWIGGMGVLVLTLALLPRLTGRTSHLVRAESPGPSLSILVPHTAAAAKLLYRIYIVITGMEFLALLLCGLSPYDAAIHTLSTAGTGGFSNYAASVGAFRNIGAEAVITVFMVLFGVNFSLYYRFLLAGPRDKIGSFFRDEEFRAYLGTVVAFMLLMTLLNLSYYEGRILRSFRYSAFEIASVFSTTGFVTENFNDWSHAAKMLIFVAMWLGACAGSTAGGIKFVRLVVLSKVIRRTIRKTGQPKKVEVVRLDGKAVEEGLLGEIAVFAIIYVTLVLFGGFLLSLDAPFATMDHLSGALTCISNVGPAFGALAGDFTGYGIFGKLVCCFLMLAGRLELFPMLMLLRRSSYLGK